MTFQRATRDRLQLTAIVAVAGAVAGVGYVYAPGLLHADEPLRALAPAQAGPVAPPEPGAVA